jgi:hypothetical protein
MKIRPTHAGLLLLLGAAWSPSAHAHGEAMVLGVLLQVGLGGGLLAGVSVVAVRRERLSFAWPFAAFLGTLAVTAAIWAQSLTAIPYAIAYGAFAAVLPFVLAYYAARYVAVRVQAFWRARKQEGGPQ